MNVRQGDVRGLHGPGGREAFALHEKLDRVGDQLANAFPARFGNLQERVPGVFVEPRLTFAVASPTDIWALALLLVVRPSPSLRLRPPRPAIGSQA